MTFARIFLCDSVKGVELLAALDFRRTVVVALSIRIWHCCALYISHHIYKIIVVRPSVTGGQRKRFDFETQEAVYLAIERWKLELGDLCERHS